MDQIKLLDANAYDYLIQRNPNSWSRVFFEMDRRCATFENRISESFNRAILGPRIKPIITMLEEIRLYIMQRLVAMNKLAFSLDDTITPSIRKRLEILKEKQREWIVYPSEFQELEVRKGDQSYGVSLQHKVCQCRMWELSGIPCVHAVAAYMYVGTDLDACVSHWGGGRSGRGDGNDGSGSGSGVIDGSGSGSAVNDGSGSGGRGGGRAGGRGKRGGGRGGRGSGRGSRGGEYQLELDEQAFKECMEEQAIAQAKIDAEQEKMDKERREEQEWQEKNDYFNPANWQEEFMKEGPVNQQYHEVLISSIHSQPTQKSRVWVMDTTVSVADVDEAPEQETSDDGPAPEQDKSPAVDKGKAKASIEDGPAPKKKRGRPPSSVDGIRIYHKNHDRSERIANMKSNKPFQFDKFGTGSTPDKAFDVEE
ncbi:agenet domain-containing protein [Tanacetum coccineum]